MARKRSTRSIENQRARQQHLGREVKDAPSVAWTRRAGYIMRDLRLHPAQQRITFAALNALAGQKGEQFMANLTSTQMRDLIRKYTWNYTVHSAGMSRDPRISGFYNSPGSLTHRVGIDVAPEAFADQKKGSIPYKQRGFNSSEVFRATIDDLDTQRMTTAELKDHKHPHVKMLHKALVDDPAAVESADGRHFYVLGHISKTVHRTHTGKSEYNLMMPRAMDYRGNARKFPPPEELIKTGFWTKWRTLLRTQDMAKLKNNAGREIELKGSFEEAVKAAQKYAWERGKPFYEILKHYYQVTKILKALEAKTRHKSGVHVAFSHEDELKHRQLTKAKAAIEDIFEGKRPEISSFTPQEREHYTKLAKGIGDSLTWYLWLLACEHQFGVRIPERQRLKTNLDKPTTQNPVQPPTDQSVIQLTGREDTPRWNIEILKNIGFRVSEFDRFEQELKKSNYNFMEQGNKAETHLWIPLFQDDLIKQGLKLMPSDISDYISRAKHWPKTQHIVGKENGVISVRHDLPFSQYNVQVRNKNFAFIPAAEYLKYFDSPKHSGRRMVHGVGLVNPSPLDTPTNVATKGPSFLKARGRLRAQAHKERMGRPNAIYDPEMRRDRFEKIGQALAYKVHKLEKAKERRQAEMEKRIAQRRGLSYPTPGTHVIGGNKITTPWHVPDAQTRFTPVTRSSYQMPYMTSRRSAATSAQTQSRAAAYRSLKGDRVVRFRPTFAARSINVMRGKERQQINLANPRVRLVTKKK